jgi:SAM-dependent methyltransferase
MNNLPFSPAADRNKQPILEALCRVLPPQGLALEIAAGTGQHTAWLAGGMPGWTWQPTDIDPNALPAIAAWVARAGVANVRPPRQLDVLAPLWPDSAQPFSEPFDAVFCANLLHIAPWAACEALMQGAARHLTPDGRLITYGPYLEDEVPTSTGNYGFDASLRATNPAWGLRHLRDVADEARQAGFSLRQRVPMPANNLLLVWARGTSAAADGSTPG